MPEMARDEITLQAEAVDAATVTQKSTVAALLSAAKEHPAVRATRSCGWVVTTALMGTTPRQIMPPANHAPVASHCWIAWVR